MPAERCGFATRGRRQRLDRPVAQKGPAKPYLRVARASRGFSLVEVLIVIALVALVTAVGIPAFNSAFRTSKESFARKMAVMLREARDRAMLNDKLVRLRIDLDKQEYWMEEAPSTYMLRKEAPRGLSEREKEEQAKQEASSFRQLKELTAEKVPMPNGLKITEVITPRQKDPVREGQTDVYFFSNGNADGVSIHFEDDEHVRQSLRLHPVTGHSTLKLGYEEGKP